MTYNSKIKTISISPDVGYILVWAAFLLSLLVVYLNFATNALPRSGFYSSDALYLPALYKDLFSGFDVFGWKLTPAPYFFPDMALYFLLNVLTGNFHLAIVFYGIIQSVLFMISLLLLSTQLFGFNKIVQSLLLLAGMIFFLMFSTGNYGEFWYIFVSAHHFGLIPVAVFAFVLTLQIIDGSLVDKKTILKLLALIVLSSLTVASDMLYVVQFVVPLIGSLFLLSFLSAIPVRKTFLLNVSLAIAVVLGVALNKTLVKYENINLYTQANQINISETGVKFSIWLSDFFALHPFLVFLWIGFMLVLIWAFVSLLKKIYSQKNNAKILLTIVFFLSAVITNVIVMAVTGEFSTRYFFPFLFIPIFFGWAFLIAGSKKLRLVVQKYYGKLILGCFFCAIILVGVSLKNVTAFSKLSNYSTPFIQCMEEKTERYGVKNGISHYWQAKHISMLSRNNLHIVQTYPDLSPFHWINNLDWYSTDFEYVIIDGSIPSLYRINETKIIRRFGQPANTFKCENSKILVYNRPEDIPFQKQFQGAPAFATFDKPGDEFEFYGVNFPSNTGEAIGFSRVADEAWGSKAGYLVYGPYIKLPQGDYSFEIHYFAEGGNTPIGKWEITLGDIDDYRIIDAGGITERGKGVISGTFVVPESQNVQARVFYNGAGALFVDKIKLKRLADSSENELATPEKMLPVEAPALQLIYPKDNALANQNKIDFVWLWTGEPLTENQAFEIRVWQKGDAAHYGAHNARESVNDVRQIGNTYTLRLSPAGFYGIDLHGSGDYLWSVAVVEIEPDYQDMNIESKPHRLQIDTSEDN